MNEKSGTANPKAGLLPGTLVYSGSAGPDKPVITCMDFGESFLREITCETIDECMDFDEKQTVKWINVFGLNNVALIESIGSRFNLHPLLQEDIVSTNQRPKFEDYDDYLFIVLKMVYYRSEEEEYEAEQISLVLGKNYIISFQEMSGDVFNAVRERIKNSKGRIRKSGPDYLAYSLIDAIVDNYYLIPERIGDVIEDLEESVLNEPVPETLEEIHNMKRRLIYLRRYIWPLREVVAALIRTDSELIGETTSVFLRDVYDHTIQVIDMMEIFREMLTSLMDIYLSSVSNKTNEIMRILTLIATIFMPLTFIAGIYGMNFENMPELRWQWGYYGVIALMAGVTAAMLVYFRRKDWI